jgi:nuclear transcription factor Y, gamma
MASAIPNNLTEDEDDIDNCIETLWKTINEESRQTESGEILDFVVVPLVFYCCDEFGIHCPFLPFLLSVEASWKCFPLPIGRVKKIMKTEEFALKEIERFARQRRGEIIDDAANKSNNVFKLAYEAQILQTKACEFFIREVTTGAWRYTDLHRRKTMQKGDVWASMGENEVYDFLIDIIPRATTSTGTTVNNTTEGVPATNATAATNAQTPLSNTTRLKITDPPTTSSVVNVEHPPPGDPPAMAAEVAQPAFNLDNVSFVPMPHTPTALDEAVRPPVQYTTPSQPWTLDGNADL